MRTPDSRLATCARTSLYARSGRQPPRPGIGEGEACKHGHPLGPRMKCGWACGFLFPGRNMRFTIFPMRPAASGDTERRGRGPKVKRCRPQGPRMKCGWGCGEQLTASRMRPHFTDWPPRCAHFTICPKRPAVCGDVERRRGTLKVKRGRPPGPRMKCG